MNPYQDKKVVVTGGAGFIGITLVHALVTAGADVTVIDLPQADFRPLPASVHSIKADLMQVDQFRAEIGNPNYVFHLAARTDLNGTCLEDYAVNYEGTRRLIAALAHCPALERFVLYSTQLVVGIFNETRFLDENEPVKTRTWYGRSKIAAEKVTLEECQKNKIPFTILRPTSVFGPYGREPYRDYFKSIYKRQYFHIGKADNLISMVYVKNLVDQTLFLAAHPAAAQKTFFGNDFHPYTMREFSDAAAGFFGVRIPTIPNGLAWLAAYGLGALKLLGVPVPLYPFRLRNIQANYCYDIGSSIRLGFFPEYELEQGMRETLSWYQDKDPDFRS